MHTSTTPPQPRKSATPPRPASIWALGRRILRASLALIAAGCSGAAAGRASDPRAVLDAVAPADLQGLAHKRVYFGHQSVGYNIVEGLEALGRERPGLALRVAKTRDPAEFEKPVFAHASNGENHKPLSKIADFTRTLDGGLSGKVDVAFFKFCYVDVEAETDVDALFAEYKAAMAKMIERHPGTRFVHVTVPLVVVQGGPKAYVKKLLGKSRWGVAANVARNRFNELLRREYEGRQPIFDLAAIEATRLDGTRSTFDEGGHEFAMLAPEYASDGKHLNELGAQWVAAHLVKTLATLGR